MDDNEKRGSGFFWKLMLLMALAVFVFSASQLYSIFSEYKDGVDQYISISDLVVQRPTDSPVFKEPEEENNEDDEKEDEDPKVTEPEKVEYIPPQIDFTELKKINKDVVAWIEVEAIPSISYPIVRANDNDYYLYRTIYKKENSAGSIFMDYRSNGNFGDCNTTIYGHNMKNGSMFGLLRNLYDNEKYKTSKNIWVCTPDATYCYEIFSMQFADVRSSTYAFYQTNGSDFLQYLIEMAMNSVVDLQAHYLTENDKIITLSTCTSDDNTRFVVQARRVATY